MKKKLPKILIVLILAGIALNIMLTRYIKEESDISSKLGQKWNGGQVSLYNYRAITKNFEYYINYLKNKDYKSAYKLVGHEYKTYKDLENFSQEMAKIEYEDLQIVSVIQRTKNMYSIIYKTKSHEKLENLMVFNEENTSFKITPETFLEYKEYEEAIKKKNVKYELLNTINYIDKYIANIRITNLGKKESVNISNIELVQSDVKHIKGNITDLKINPEETKTITVEFKTYIDFPNKIEISRYIEKKDKTEVCILNIEE